MPTKDPHIALIDAHEKLEHIKLYIKKAASIVQTKLAHGIMPSEDEIMMLKAIRAEAIERAKKIQDELYEELEGHGKLT